MPIDPQTTVEALTVAHPHTRRQLGRLGVDIQGEGALTLQEACARHGLALSEVLKELDAVTYEPPPSRDWMSASRKELVSHIISHHHSYTRDELGRLDTLLDQALGESSQTHAQLLQIRVHLRNLAEDLMAHLQMEERNLFPAICANETDGPVPISLSTPQELLRTIQAEHQTVEELFLNLRLLTSDYGLPANASPSLRALYLGLRDLEDDLHVHLYLENHLLFPRVLPGAAH